RPIRAASVGAQLKHGIRVRLVKLELAECSVGSLTHHEVLAGGIDVAEAALQRVGIEECSTAQGLEGNCYHPLCNLGDISARRASRGLPGRLWNPPRSSFLPETRQDLESESARGCELQLCLPQGKLKVRVGRERGRWKAAALLDRLLGDLIQGATG